MSKSKKLNEELFETMLTHTVSEEAEQDLDDLMNQVADLPDPPYSDEFRSNMDVLLKQATAQEKKKKHLSAWKRAAAIFLIVGAAGASALSVEAVRINIKNWFITITGGNLSITSDYNAYIPESWDGAYFIEVLPEGVQIVDSEDFDSFLEIKYAAGNDYINFYQGKDVFQFALLDGEDVETEHLMINNCQALLSTKGAYRSLIWQDGENQYLLYSSFTNDEIIAAAKSLKYFSK